LDNCIVWHGTPYNRIMAMGYYFTDLTSWSKRFIFID